MLKQQSMAIQSIRYDSGKKLACWPSETMQFSDETKPYFDIKFLPPHLENI